MKLPKTVHNNLFVALVASLLLLDGLSAALKPSLDTRGEAVSGLQMTIYLDQSEGPPPEAPRFRVELRNAGRNDVVVNLGMTLANGKRQYPNAVVLILTDAQGKSRRLDLREPVVVAGRVDPLVVSIPLDATFSIPVNLDRYWTAASDEFAYKLKPGTYTIEARFTGRSVSQQEANLDAKGISLMPYWTGMVTSNPLRFSVPSE